MKAWADRILQNMRRDFDAAYAKTGRPGIPPEQLLKAQLLRALYSIGSERRLMEAIVGNLCVIGRYLKQAVVQGVKVDGIEVQADSVFDYLKLVLGFAKAMSRECDDFHFLDESEWRIVHTHAMEQDRRLVATGCQRPIYRVPVPRGELRLVVFPDDTTRNRALEEDDLRASLQDPVTGKGPTLLTLDECAQFWK